MKILAGVLIVLLLAVLAARYAPAPRGGQNFSSYPGFDDYFKRFPPGDAVPAAADRALLEAHRPRFHRGPGAEGPISFYDDYIACGTLASGQNPHGAGNVTRETLNAVKNDRFAVFTHRSCGTARAVVLGRVDRITAAEAPLNRGLTFLTYHAVFRTSGLPAGMAWWQKLAMMAVGDVADWHQLDHYTAVSIVLNEAGRPVAMMMQQHNYMRSFLIDGAGPVEIDIALGSNELYPHAEGRRERKAVSFMDAKSLRYMIGLEGAPLMAAMDITDPARVVDYTLDLLPPSDAFYTFKGWLGARRRLPGRDGPPGAQYNTPPAFKPLGVQLALSFWREGDAGDIAALPASGGTAALMEFARRQAAVLNGALRRD